MPNVLENGSTNWNHYKGIERDEVMKHRDPESFGDYGKEINAVVQNVGNRIEQLLFLKEEERNDSLEKMYDQLGLLQQYLTSTDPAMTPQPEELNRVRGLMEDAFLQDEVRPNCTWGRDMYGILGLAQEGLAYEGLSQLTRRALSYLGYHVDRKLIRPRQEGLVYTLANAMSHTPAEQEFLDKTRTMILTLEENRKRALNIGGGSDKTSVTELKDEIDRVDALSANVWKPEALPSGVPTVSADNQKEGLETLEGKNFPEDFAELQVKVLETLLTATDHMDWSGFGDSADMNTVIGEDLLSESPTPPTPPAIAEHEKVSPDAGKKIIAKLGKKMEKKRKELEEKKQEKMAYIAASNTTDVTRVEGEIAALEETIDKQETLLEQFQESLDTTESSASAHKETKDALVEDIRAHHALMARRLDLERRGTLSLEEQNEVELLLAQEKEIAEDMAEALKKLGKDPEEFYTAVEEDPAHNQARGVYEFIRHTMEMVRRDCQELDSSTGHPKLDTDTFLDEHIVQTDARMAFLMKHRDRIADVLDTFFPESVQHAEAKLWFRHMISSTGCKEKQLYGESLSVKALQQEAKIHYEMSALERPMLFCDPKKYEQRKPQETTVANFLLKRRKKIHDAAAAFGAWEHHATIGKAIGFASAFVGVKLTQATSFLIGSALDRGGHYLLRQPSHYLAEAMTARKLWPLYPLWPIMKTFEGIGYMTSRLGDRTNQHVTYGALNKDNQQRFLNAMGNVGSYAGSGIGSTAGWAADQTAGKVIGDVAYKQATDYASARTAFDGLRSGLGSEVRTELRTHISPRVASSVDVNAVLNRIKEKKGTLAADVLDMQTYRQERAARLQKQKEEKLQKQKEKGKQPSDSTEEKAA